VHLKQGEYNPFEWSAEEKLDEAGWFIAQVWSEYCLWILCKCFVVKNNFFRKESQSKRKMSIIWSPIY